MKTKSLFFMITALLVIIVTSCHKETCTPTPSAPSHENELFYFAGSTSLFQDYQLCYFYQNGKFNDPAINRGSFPAQSFKLIDNNSLEVQLKSVYTGETAYIIAEKLPIKYADYGAYRLTTDKYEVYNGLFQIRTGGQTQENDFVLALNSENKSVIICSMPDRKVIKKTYSLRYDSAGDPELVISDLNFGMGPEKWIITKNPFAPNTPGLCTWVIEDESGNLFVKTNALVAVDDKRL